MQPGFVPVSRCFVSTIAVASSPWIDARSRIRDVPIFRDLSHWQIGFPRIPVGCQDFCQDSYLLRTFGWSLVETFGEVSPDT